MANTWHVGKCKKFSSVNAAIRASANGDTILVYAGTYYEKNIVVNKKLLLKGIGHPVLDGEKKYEVISVKANGSVIDGFTIVHSGVSSIEDMGGIKIYDSRDVVIQNNILEDTFFGIYVQYGKNCTVQNNQLVSYNLEEQQSGNGIHCWKSDSLRIIGNRITGHRDGIYFEFVTNSVIWLNTSFKNIRYGLHFMFSHNDAYIANNFRNNGAGVAVMFSHGVKMYSNVFEENWGDAAYGLLLKEISDSYIDGNTFIKNTTNTLLHSAFNLGYEWNDTHDKLRLRTKKEIIKLTDKIKKDETYLISNYNF
ncbi:MAG: NosD domain-containing protein, partial [Bacteroidota bacterium]